AQAALWFAVAVLADRVVGDIDGCDPSQGPSRPVTGARPGGGTGRTPGRPGTAPQLGRYPCQRSGPGAGQTDADPYAEFYTLCSRYPEEQGPRGGRAAFYERLGSGACCRPRHRPLSLQPRRSLVHAGPLAG